MALAREALIELGYTQNLATDTWTHPSGMSISGEMMAYSNVYTSTTNATASISFPVTNSTTTTIYNGSTLPYYQLGYSYSQPQPQPTKENDNVKINGKEFLVMRKGMMQPMSSHATREDALEEATDLTNSTDAIHYVYAPVAKVSPASDDVKVTDIK